MEVSKELMIPQFKLRTFDFADCSKRYATGNFSCLKASFYLDRDVGYYIIQTYLPSVLVVVLSWVAFWIDPAAVPARVTFGVFTTLILSTMSSSVRSTLPRVSYVKAIDVWMSVCMFFVFTALIEYAIVNVVLRQKAKRPPPKAAPIVRDRSDDTRVSTAVRRNTGDRTVANPGMAVPTDEVCIRGGVQINSSMSGPYMRPGSSRTPDNSNNQAEIWIPLEPVRYLILILIL